MEGFDATEFANRLKGRRVYMRLTQSDLEEKARLGKGTVARYETGSANPSSDRLVALADALETTPSYLLGWGRQEHGGQEKGAD